MERIGILKGMRLCRAYSRSDAQKREHIRAARLSELVAHARQHSPYYAALYRDVPPDAPLSALPPVNKRDLMAHFDEWLTDRAVTGGVLERFMADPDNIGRRLHGRYYVFTTSGSTGNPLVTLCDETVFNVMGAINACRSFARGEDLRAFIRRGGKTIGVFATDGFYLGCGSVRAKQLASPRKRNQIATTSALLPTGRIVETLNAFSPAMLGGYPSSLALLADEARAGRLNIQPVLVMTGGEHLSDELRARLSDAFGCYVQTSYACTEGGTIACECRHQHFHINDDWLIVEPVDACDRPVADGETADHILLTNLFNHTQPFIRYAVTDRVVRHGEGCACGNPAPWLELEGRSDDMTCFAGRDAACVRIPPLALYAALQKVRALRRFQLVVEADNRALLRLEPAAGTDAETAFLQAETALRAYLRTHGIERLSLVFDARPPEQDPGSGKFKHVISRI